jgi:hypothetical protein
MIKKQDKILIIDLCVLSQECVDFLHSKEINTTLLQFSSPKDYVYGSSLIDRLENIFQRIVLRNKNFSYILKYKAHRKHYVSELKKFLKHHKNFDYCLIIRPDTFDVEFFKTLQKKTKYNIGYMWDAMNDYKYSELLKTKKFLKKILVFEETDLVKYPKINGIKGSNFYYEIPSFKALKKENLVSYIGHITSERRDILIDQMIPYFLSQNFNLDFQLVINVKTENYDIKNKNLIQYSKIRKPYTCHLKMMARSKISLDLNPSYHEEFSFRVYESMYYETKLITTNKKILQFPLYRKENFLLIENQDDLEKIPEFIKEKYAPYSEEELAVYRFDNWLINVFKP